MSVSAPDTHPYWWLMARRLRNAALLLGSCVLGSYVAVAAVVSMQQPETGGGVLRIPVVLYGDGDEALSGVQFDVQYDPAAYELVEVDGGAAALDAGKEVIVSSPVPGAGRVLITGFNNAELFDGHVATVVLRPLVPDAETHTLGMDHVLATDPFGNPVEIGYEDLYAFPPAAPEPSEAPVAAEETSETSETGGDDPESSDDGGIRTETPRGENESSGEDAEVPLANTFGAPGLDGPNQSATAPAANPQSVLRAPLRAGSPVPIATGSGTSLSAPSRGASPPSGAGSLGGAAGGGDRGAGAGVRQARIGGSSDGASRQRSAEGASAGTDGDDVLRSIADTPVRLAFSYPVADAFAPSAAGGAVLPAGSTGGAIDSGLSAGITGIAVVLGTGVFLLLVAGRALLLDRGMRRHWRKGR